MWKRCTGAGDRPGAVSGGAGREGCVRPRDRRDGAFDVLDLAADDADKPGTAVLLAEMDNMGLCSADPIHVAHADTARYG